MNRIRSVPLASIAALALAVGGCDDGTSPIDLHGLDPLRLTDVLYGLTEPMNAGSEPVGNIRLAMEDLRNDSIHLELGTDEEAVHFPPEVVGRTYAYDTSLPGWRIDESFADVGAGVRMLWYARDGSGEVAVPLQMNGYIDLRPAAGAETEGVTIRAVDTRNGDTDLLDYTQRFVVSQEGVATDSVIEAHGRYSDGVRTVEFSFRLAVSVDPASGDSEASLSAELQDAETSYRYEFQSTQDGATNSIEDRVVATIQHQGETTILEAEGQFPNSVTGTLRHGGIHILDILPSTGGLAWRDEQGNPPPPTQATELNTFYNALPFPTGYLLNLLFFVPIPGF